MKTYICRFTYKKGNGYALVAANRVSAILEMLLNQKTWDGLHITDVEEVVPSICVANPQIITSGNITTLGSSAYDVAVLLGFKGTPSEWLNSLKGSLGPQGPMGPKGEKGLKGEIGIRGPLGERGPAGTLGPQGPKGERGLTGLLGPIGLKGDKGDLGIQGPKGDKGDTGEKGDKGDSAYLIAVNNGFIGSELEWLDSLLTSVYEELNSIEGRVQGVEGLLYTLLDNNEEEYNNTVNAILRFLGSIDGPTLIELLDQKLNTSDLPTNVSAFVNDVPYITEADMKVIGINNNNYEYVDLGLPSGTLWATKNVGAETETDYGEYYMYGKGSRPYNRTDARYNTPGRLPLSADTAYLVMGGDWHMPTVALLQELVNNTTHLYVTNYNESGKNGVLFTATNNNTLFIPASGYMQSGSLYLRGLYGFIWGSENACSLGFTSSQLTVSPSTNVAGNGYTIRGVLEPSLVDKYATKQELAEVDDRKLDKIEYITGDYLATLN